MNVVFEEQPLIHQAKVDVFGADYYLRGPETGLSNYTDYRWLEEKTVPACRKLMEYLGAHPGESVLDVGAARGFYVKALRRLGYRAYGCDVSEWAVSNCDPEVREWMSLTPPERAFDWAHLKDVCEHIPEQELARLVTQLNATITKGMLFIVPLAEFTGGPYLRAEDEMDATHLIRWTLEDWIAFLEDHARGFNVNASFNIHGLKPAAAAKRHSCGFFTLIRP